MMFRPYALVFALLLLVSCGVSRTEFEAFVAQQEAVVDSLENNIATSEQELYQTKMSLADTKEMTHELDRALEEAYITLEFLQARQAEDQDLGAEANYRIQVAAKSVEQLQDDWLEEINQQPYMTQEGDYVRVFIGSYKNWDEAKKQLEFIRKFTKFKDAWIVKVNETEAVSLKE